MIILAMLEAVVASMQVVRASQGGGIKAEIKGDKTLLTATDKESETAGMRVLTGCLSSEIGVHAEERGKVKVGSMGIVLFDPIDGTKPFVIGALTSTVISAFYDETLKQVTVCVVGEPASGRVWTAEFGGGAYVRKFDFATYQFGPEVPVHVTPQSIPKSGATVFLDLYPGFTRKDAQVLSNEECTKLFGALFGKFGVSMLGSNGMHHALVANGGQGVAGAITTAIGGPWDVAPVLLVLQAGGFARAFSVEQGGEYKEQDPLDVFSYQFLVTGNSQETVDELSQALLSVRS